MFRFTLFWERSIVIIKEAGARRIKVIEEVEAIKEFLIMVTCRRYQEPLLDPFSALLESQVLAFMQHYADLLHGTVPAVIPE